MIRGHIANAEVGAAQGTDFGLAALAPRRVAASGCAAELRILTPRAASATSRCRSATATFGSWPKHLSAPAFGMAHRPVRYPARSACHRAMCAE